MKHEHWIIEDANLVIEKYTGVVNKDDFNKGQGKLYRELDLSRPIKSITDVSEAIFFNIKHDQAKVIFDELRARLGAGTKGNFVLLNGNNSKDDYLKTSLFTKYETPDIKIQNFLDIEDATEWLGLTKADFLKVYKLLNDH